MAKKLSEGRKAGSGRPVSVKTLMKQQSPTKFPVEDVFIPNYSGDHSAGNVQDTPVNEKDLVNKEYVDNLIRGSIDLFLTENGSDIGTYFDLETDIVTAAKEDITQAITGNSTTLIAAFATILNEPEVDAITLLELGVYSAHLHASTNFAIGMTLYFEFYHRTAGGVETLLGTSHDSSTLTTSEVGYGLHATITSDKAFIAGDRIVIKVYGRNAGAPAKNITIYMEGDTAVRVELPGLIASTFVPAHVSTHETGGSDAISHDSIDDVSADDHHNQSHTVASHSDTSGTGTELNTLTDNSMADGLHRHSELSASDGTPDACLAVDASGVVTISTDAPGVDTQYTAQVLYNTDATPPAASGFPIGTIYIQYTA